MAWKIFFQMWIDGKSWRRFFLLRQVRHIVGKCDAASWSRDGKILFFVAICRSISVYECLCFHNNNIFQLNIFMIQDFSRSIQLVRGVPRRHKQIRCVRLSTILHRAWLFGWFGVKGFYSVEWQFERICKRRKHFYFPFFGSGFFSVEKLLLTFEEYAAIFCESVSGLVAMTTSPTLSFFNKTFASSKIMRALGKRRSYPFKA